LHFIFKISGDLFGNLALKLSAQLSFQNVSEFGLCWAEKSLSTRLPIMSSDNLNIKVKSSHLKKFVYPYLFTEN
jgi:hypothetical protein